MSNNKPIPVQMDETDVLKWGDLFTIAVDKTAKNWQMVDGKTFIAVRPTGLAELEGGCE